MKKLFSLLALLLFAMSFQLQAQNPIFSDALKKNIEKRIKDETITGIAIGVITEDGVSFLNYGVKSYESNDPVDEFTIFEIGSNTKTFTGVLLGTEVLKGAVKLNDPLQKYVPKGITVPTYKGNEIQLVNLANHSSSLPRTALNLVRENHADPYNMYSVQDLYQSLNTLELTRDIGSKFDYSNYGISLLGSVLADIYKQDYEEYVLNTIAKPLGMNSTQIAITSEIKRNFAFGHNRGIQVGSWKWTKLGIAPAGALRSNVVDMLKYLEANMGLKETELYPAMKLAHKLSGSGDGSFVEAGLGWFTSDVAGKEVIWHDGGTTGFMSFMGFTKDGKKGVILLTNSTGFPDDIGFHILNPEYELANPKPSIGIKINSLLREEGLESSLKIFEDLRKNHADEYNFQENEFIRLGYLYIAKGKTEEAVAVFKMCVDTHPEAWNAYDSYGDALKANKEIKKAIESYKKSIELNPENSNGIEMLKKLEDDTEGSEK